MRLVKIFTNWGQGIPTIKGLSDSSTFLNYVSRKRFLKFYHGVVTAPICSFSKYVKISHDFKTRLKVIKEFKTLKKLIQKLETKP